MGYKKSSQSFKAVDDAAAKEHHAARRLWKESQEAEEKGQGASAHFKAHIGNKADERATRLGKASNYLSRRASRDYGSATLNAKANLMKEQRLSADTGFKQNVAEEVSKAEAKLPKTTESLNTLGAGQPYGSTS